jgi:hypothetical protein
MTPKQIEKAKAQIVAIRKAISDEKRQWGGYHDGRGLRYAPPQYYVKINDFKGAMTYFRWFHKNFEDDCGAPYFLFEWCITLFKNGKLKDAEKKAVETFMANTYLIDTFLGEPFHAFDNLEYSEWHKEQVMKSPYSAEQEALKDFADWLSQFVESEKYQTITKAFIDNEILLLTEPAGKKRNELVDRKYRMVDDFFK